MRIQFLGAARTVTGSKHLITTENNKKILLDCGLFQGIQTDDVNLTFGFNASEIDYVILSHAHIDHSGLLPRLVRQGFNGPIYTTGATASLCEIMLMDSAHIQEKDVERLNKRRMKQNRPLLEELYNSEDAAKVLSLLEPVPYHSPVLLDGDNIVFHFSDAGHLLGSAAVHLDIADKGSFTKITFTGDIGRMNDQILRKPEEFQQADYLICESTYGDRLHPEETDMLAHLEKVVLNTCIEKKGKLLIPAFAVDRTQELIYALDRLSTQGRLPRIPVYIDSPLALKATTIMKQHDECFNPEVLEYIERDGDAFAFPYLHYISDVADSKALNESTEACIIISSSGMAEAGRIKHHLLNHIENERNTVLLVGYAGAHTLAGAIKNGAKEVKIFGTTCQVNADVQVMDSFSGHADYKEMLHYLSCQEPEKTKGIFLVHGDYDTQLAFKQRLQEAGFENIRIPFHGEVIEL